MRIFFAIDLPEEVKLTLSELISSLQNQNQHHAIRWVKPHHLHVTLQFLAEIEQNDLQKLIDQVKKELRSTKPFFLKLGPLELFPLPYHPKIIALNTEPQMLLKQLSIQIGAGMKACGYLPEHRPYRGHLTLGRLHSPDQLPSLSHITLPECEKIAINEIILFQSEPNPEGSVYTPLAKFLL